MALNLARLALEIAGLVPGEESQRSRLRGYARHHLGNALRVQHLTRVRGEFVTRKIWYDAALVTLKLAEVFLGQGQTAMVKTLAVHLKPIFQAQGVHPEAMAALTLFAKAAEKEKVTAEMARGVVTYLRKARHQPGLRFQVR